MFKIIYSKNTGRIRRHTGTGESELTLEQIKINDGEDYLILDDKQYGNLIELQEIVNGVTGLIPQDDRFAVVDKNGYVQGSVIADIACGDSIPDMELIKDNHAGAGWIYDKSDGFMNMEFVLMNKKNSKSIGNASDVSLLAPNDKVQIKYTTDGTEPSVTNGHVYTGTFPVTKSSNIKVANVYKDKIGRIISYNI